MDPGKGEGNSINFKYRMHDPRVGRFFANDPMEAEFPWNSPYAFSENRVIGSVELEGLEQYPAHIYQGHPTGDINNDYELDDEELAMVGKVNAAMVVLWIDIYITRGKLATGLGMGDLFEAFELSDQAVEAERMGDFQRAEALRDAVGEKSTAVLTEVLGGAAAYGLGKVIHAAAKLNKSGSKLISTAQLDEAAKNYPESTTFGDPKGEFIAPSSEIDDLLSQGLSRNEIANKLGINDPNFLEGDLIRIDIDDNLAKELNMRQPTGSESGANENFIPGGKTSGGVTEQVVDGIPKKSDGVKVTILKDN